MLYNNFVVCMMTCAIFAIFCMVDAQEYKYIILPIGILIWGIFKFFDANDRKYLEERGIDPDEFNYFFSEEDYYDTHYPYQRNRYHSSSSNKSIYAPSNPNNVRREDNTITWDSPSDTRRESPMYNGGFGSFGGTYNEYPRRRHYQNPAYKGMVDKCKRNFKISITKGTEEKDESRRGIFHSVHSGS